MTNPKETIREKRWIEFTDIELIILAFVTIIGSLTNIIAGLIMFGIGIIIHTIGWLIIK